ncbi:beta-hydroxyacyl-(acyl-carrier-protein) dehydratase FabZ [Oleidesulfovibrio alaskensis G20]|jgi:3-hydroxyacyl-[acyl-carrier-protein] dehydratase|uniref:3-hydroxyacyl-[acyl-carrier-protein] dehydratase FabZ n=1 Tax=Oleidesulfovibrio alaskensis (strain ATCC BAA-1058 / DSM 17464 / G20) TaxID=207559 RepID=FABZ_OLEA2|nr:3-hydroxyacyl-ACP dehydratase FabZ [Oleidesulfovibrio alaskensis]Q312H2.1 RecName: Full=3-hydroxyacyl-[acyl-carrier-protein] dehydratase FabZ; AltName: Full=(3R)-hydroxymyristoyl-[acyl-carrier-protein] dehydratase; Short=(3R)-hydroxymyristoyl-ACP dehydrase; AltName: Full=Beta-hydroxyacyl-ACP dehydratase [Oleidesulfovibrio alaskensis G20]ABB38174.1 beta-hydroxyacyl-(acyl-carrier-protein) dehydratase FabZ [Oleidesulfovibrio alaskensis G20]MBG0774457.1 3-hydroxyacyl-ACP dehydratase FabZ [Oleides
MNDKAKSILDIRQILGLLPHRYPFLLVDRVLDYTPGECITAVKNVTMNEPFFQGHFPDVPVMPGVLIMEALAQAGGILVVKSTDTSVEGKLFLFTGMERVRFRKPVYPGDRLELHCRLLRHKLKLWKMEGKAYVDGQLAAEAEMTAAVMNREDM